MNTTQTKGCRRRETGFRLYEDQIRQLDLLVQLSRGRRKRSHLVLEAIDEYLASRVERHLSAAA